MDREDFDGILVITAILLIIINIIGWGISIRYSKEFNKYKAACDNYVEENLTEDALNNLLVELETAPKELMAGVRRFVSNIMLNIIIDSLCIVKLIYDYRRNEYLAKNVCVNKINAICYFLIFLVSVFSIKSYIDQVQNFLDLRDTCISVLDSVFFRMNYMLDAI